ncbi:MAG TPA: hypothetical protein VHK90_12425, partial [Thermoanaerobaculia bacterium]|nr:hypothetical protein [Thermoanaerobaculia bacterium]
MVVAGVGASVAVAVVTGAGATVSDAGAGGVSATAGGGATSDASPAAGGAVFGAAGAGTAATVGGAEGLGVLGADFVAAGFLALRDVVMRGRDFEGEDDVTRRCVRVGGAGDTDADAVRVG